MSFLKMLCFAHIHHIYMYLDENIVLYYATKYIYMYCSLDNVIFERLGDSSMPLKSTTQDHLSVGLKLCTLHAFYAFIFIVVWSIYNLYM